MSKTWETKKKIIDLLYEDNKTLTEISTELSLTLATVKQHLDELESMGAVRKVDNPHIKKWKYYAINPKFNASTLEPVEQPPLQKYPRYFISIAVVLLALGLFYFFTYHSNTFGQQTSNGTILMSVSDSPLSSNLSYVQMSAINLTVSSISVRSASNSRIYTVLNTPTQFNLIQLRNVSKLITNASIPTGTYDEIIFNVSSANVTIANASETLFIPSRHLRFFYDFNVTHNSTSWVNLDFNLFKSIRFTGSGKVIMLPVVSVTDEHGARLALGRNKLIASAYGGTIVNRSTYNMQVNGTLGSEAAVSPNAQLDVDPDGRIISSANMPSAVSIYIIDNGSFTIIRKANVSANAAGNVSISVPGITGVRSNGNAIVSCEVINGEYACDAHRERLDINSSTAVDVVSQVSTHHETNTNVSSGIGTGTSSNASSSRSLVLDNCNSGIILYADGSVRCGQFGVSLKQINANDTATLGITYYANGPTLALNVGSVTMQINQTQKFTTLGVTMKLHLDNISNGTAGISMNVSGASPVVGAT